MWPLVLLPVRGPCLRDALNGKKEPGVNEEELEAQVRAIADGVENVGVDLIDEKMGVIVTCFAETVDLHAGGSGE
ncbi:hypothetical protein ACN469_15065 [Corallococcus terminator]